MGQAITTAQRLVENEPENERAYDFLFTCVREVHETDKAMSIGANALAVAPFDADLHYRFGLAAGESGDIAVAVTQLAYAVLLDPRKTEYEQKLRVALSFLQQSPNGADAIHYLQPLAANSPKLLEILDSYRQDSTSTSPDRP